MERQPNVAWQSFLIAVMLAIVPMVVVACKQRLSVAECETLWSTADRQIAKVIAAHATCVRDEDCELVQSPNGCLWSCNTAIARTGRAEYDATKTRLQGQECKEWQSGECLQTTPKAVPSCASPTPRCQNERCTAVLEPRR